MFISLSWCAALGNVGAAAGGIVAGVTLAGVCVGIAVCLWKSAQKSGE